ncbi:hypothetical protein ACVWWG_000828 [Bradyrhizobium sp. LB7.2]
MEMNWQNSFGSRCYRGLDQAGIHRPCYRVDVDKHRPRAAVENGRGRRDERHGYCDDFVTGSNARRQQGKVKRGSATVHRAAMGGPAIIRKATLEGGDLRPEHKVPASEDPSHRGVDFRLDLAILGFQIKEGYQDSKPYLDQQDIKTINPHYKHLIKHYTIINIFGLKWLAKRL